MRFVLGDDPMVHEERLLSFSAVFFPPLGDGESLVSEPVKFFAFKETDLKGGFELQKFHWADVLIHREEEGEMDPNLYPPGASLAYCPVTRSFLIVGGNLLALLPAGGLTPTRSLWSFPAAAPQPHPALPSCYTWGIRATMSEERSCGLAVPCGGLVYIFGGETSPQPLLEIYDPRSGSLDPPVLLPGHIFAHRFFYPQGYFLWRDCSKPPHKKPLIMLNYHHLLTRQHLLLSFDVEERQLDIFDSQFPPLGTQSGMTRLVPLDGTNTLLIMQTAGLWLVYDLSSRRNLGLVRFVGFKKNLRREVMHGLCRQCSDGSHIVYIFMDGFQEEGDTSQFSVPYAKFSVKKEEEEFVATLESEGALGNGECTHFSIFADQVTVPEEEEAPDIPLSDDECRLGKRRR